MFDPSHNACNIAAMKLYRSAEVADQWIGEDRHGALVIWPAQPRGWMHRTPYTGGKRQLEEVSPALARGTGWPGAVGGKVRAPSGAPSKPVGVRATDEERAAWVRAAGERKLSDWIWDTLNAAAAAAAATQPLSRTTRSKGKL